MSEDGEEGVKDLSDESGLSEDDVETGADLLEGDIAVPEVKRDIFLVPL